MTCCFLIQVVLCPKKKKRKKLGGVALPKKNPEPTPATTCNTTETSTTTDIASTTNSVAVRCLIIFQFLLADQNYDKFNPFSQTSIQNSLPYNRF